MMFVMSILIILTLLPFRYGLNSYSSRNLRNNSNSTGVSCGTNQIHFLGTCFCEPGWNGQDCDVKISAFDDCICQVAGGSSHSTGTLSRRCIQLCHSNEIIGIPRVHESLWKKSSDAEFKVWKDSGPVVSDRGKEHCKGFQDFSFLQSSNSTLGDILEVGAGPHTQTQTIIDTIRSVLINSITLIEPNLDKYKTLPHCPYSSGSLGGYPTTLLSTPVEQMKITKQYDTIININVIEHVQDAFAYFSNIYQSLKPGGLLIFHERWHNNIDFAKCKPNGDFLLHPIRIRKPLLDYFLSLFEKLPYFSDAPTIEMEQRKIDSCEGVGIETAYYVAVRKK